MKRIFIKNIQSDSDVCDYFLVKQKEINKSKDDRPYLALKLCDKTGEIDARIWDNVESISSVFDKGDVIFITRGLAKSYQKKIQISITELRKANKSEINVSDFIEATPFATDEMLKELKSHFKYVKSKHLKKLLNAFFEDPAFIEAFCVSPAAKSIHHAYLGGLLEHTLSVTKLAKLITQNYPDLNEEILITGAILHDIGKTQELSSNFNFEYTNSGRLIGHLVIGALMVEKKVDQIKDFPAKLSNIIKHMILSHHGIYEWGSPKKPKTLEAFVLHQADELDAKIVMIKNALKRELGDKETGWTNYNSLLERYLFKEDYDFDKDAEKQASEDKGKKNKLPDENQFSMFEE